MRQRTLAIIKPDAVARKLTGEIIRRIERSGLEVVALKMVHLSKREAEDFYAIHKQQKWFDSLTSYMSEGPVVLMILSGENAIQAWRGLMGPTDPANASPGSIRGDYGQSIERNSSHGSDAPETSAFETAYFFSRVETCGAGQ